MKELSEYRSALMKRLEAAAREFQTACLAARNPFTVVSQGDWNIHQIAAHARDVQVLVYGLRARRTLAEENPEFQYFDSDAHARAQYSTGEPLETILTGFMQNVEEQISLLRNLPESAWSRVSRHEKYGGGLTLQAWVERGLAHIEEHLETVKRLQ